MMPITHKKEAICRAFIRAITAKAGYPISEGPDYGDDFTVKGINLRPRPEDRNGYRRNGFDIAISAKSTINIIEREDHIVYDIEKKNYNDLVDVNTGTPLILVLLHIPDNENDWCQINDDSLVLKRKAYWHYMKGETPILDRDNGTKRISIPKSRVFNDIILKRMMELRKNGGDLNEL